MGSDILRHQIAKNFKKSALLSLAVCWLFAASVSRTAEAADFSWGPEQNGFSIGVKFDFDTYREGTPVSGFVAVRTTKALPDEILCHDLSDYGFTIIPNGSTKALPTTMSWGFSGPLEKLAKILTPNKTLEERFDLSNSSISPGARILFKSIGRFNMSKVATQGRSSLTRTRRSSILPLNDRSASSEAVRR